MSEKVDYLIVGLGIAGACFAKQCIDHNKSFKIIADDKRLASHVAAGMFNPIILFRFTTIHRAEEQMDDLLNTFGEFEQLLGQKLIHPQKIYRVFANEYETKIWQKKIAKKPILQRFLKPEIIPNTFEGIHAPYGFGEVMDCGWVDMSLLLDEFSQQFEENILHEHFDYNDFDHETKCYKDIQAEHVIFAEGINVIENPWFNHVPLIRNKGEILVLEIEQELPDIIFKSKNFLMPMGGNRYYVGATYDTEYETAEPTEKNKEMLLEKLSTYYKGDYKIVEQHAAFRPTVIDRRSIIGEHPQYTGLYILNGMGTRGSFNAPNLAKYLFSSIEDKASIPEEYQVSRFNNLM